MSSNGRNASHGIDSERQVRTGFLFLSFYTLSYSSQKPFWPIGNSQLSQRIITQTEPLSRATSIFRGALKFIRYGQHFIEKNSSGILAFITNNSFLDGVTTREMRKTLLKSFDKIYILDLHGDVKKRLSIIDENVFDIQQGVSINIFIKQSQTNKTCSFNYAELYGKRQDKYNFLQDNTINSVKWENLVLNKHYAFFNVVGNSSIVEYEKGFVITELFKEYNSGIQTKNDDLLVNYKIHDAKVLIDNIKNKDINFLKEKYKTSEGAWTWESA